MLELARGSADKFGAFRGARDVMNITSECFMRITRRACRIIREEI